MSEHLSTDYVARYLKRALSPGEQTAAARHLVVCEACRNRVGESAVVQETFASLRHSIDTQGGLEPIHIPYEQLEAYVDNKIDDADREIVDSHVEQCRVCKDELRDLQTFREAHYATGTETRLPYPQHSRDREETAWRKFSLAFRSPRYLAGATAVAMLIVAGVVVPRLFLRRGSAPVVAEQLPASPPHGHASPTTEQPPVALSLPGTPPPGLPKNLAQKLEMPSDLVPLIGQRGTLMGSSDENASLTLRSPVGTFIQTARPTFRWHGLKGATEYKVQVFDSSLNEVVTSPSITATVWESGKPLQRGRVYLWQVMAVKGTENIVSPAPPAPQAKFKVIDQFQASELDKLKRSHPDAHFSLGRDYAAAGLLDDAELEFRLVPASDSNYALAQKFLSELQAFRTPKR